MESGVWSVESGVWSVESGVWSVECGVWSYFVCGLSFTIKLLFDTLVFVVSKKFLLTLQTQLSTLKTPHS